MECTQVHVGFCKTFCYKLFYFLVPFLYQNKPLTMSLRSSQTIQSLVSAIKPIIGYRTFNHRIFDYIEQLIKQHSIYRTFDHRTFNHRTFQSYDYRTFDHRTINHRTFYFMLIIKVFFGLSRFEVILAFFFQLLQSWSTYKTCTTF